MTVPVAAAQARAAAARARALATWSALLDRLAPATIARNTVDTARKKTQEAARTGIDTASRHPGVAAGAAVAAIAFFARRPLAGLIAGRTDETPAPPAGLTRKRQRAVSRRKSE